MPAYLWRSVASRRADRRSDRALRRLARSGLRGGRRARVRIRDSRDDGPGADGPAAVDETGGTAPRGRLAPLPETARPTRAAARRSRGATTWSTSRRPGPWRLERRAVDRDAAGPGGLGPWEGAVGDAGCPAVARGGVRIAVPWLKAQAGFFVYVKTRTPGLARTPCRKSTRFSGVRSSDPCDRRYIPASKADNSSSIKKKRSDTRAAQLCRQRDERAVAQTSD